MTKPAALKKAPYLNAGTDFKNCMASFIEAGIFIALSQMIDPKIKMAGKV